MIATSRSEVTTTETNPEQLTAAMTRDTPRPMDQENRRLRPALPLRENPAGGEPFQLDELFQERSDTHRRMRSRPEGDNRSDADKVLRPRADRTTTAPEGPI
jgi:hypothetical protein